MQSNARSRIPNLQRQAYYRKKKLIVPKVSPTILVPIQNHFHYFDLYTIINVVFPHRITLPVASISVTIMGLSSDRSVQVLMTSKRFLCGLLKLAVYGLGCFFN